MADRLTVSPHTARRLAVSAQRLHQTPLAPEKQHIFSIIRQLGCLQIDPINVVARSPLLVLWSRLGRYRLEDFETLLWTDRRLFEYWAHAASLVLVEDFPIFQHKMRNFSRGNSKWARRVRRWLADNAPFRQYILDELARRGPLYAKELEDRSLRPWQSTGWTNSRNVSTMLGFMWEQGDITVTRRQGSGFGLRKQWGLLEQFMPAWKDAPPLPEHHVVKIAVQKSLKALGIATPKNIENHYVRGSYPGLIGALDDLMKQGYVQRMDIRENGRLWPGEWYIHVDSLRLLASARSKEWPSRTTLLSPFDNLIADRGRTEELFGFHYRSEIYTPKAKRQYGYYAMPILSGDRLIGRIDPKLDRKQKTLHVRALYLEQDAPDTTETARDVVAAIEQLGRFLGADSVRYGAAIPPSWSASFKDTGL